MAKKLKKASISFNSRAYSEDISSYQLLRYCQGGKWSHYVNNISHSYLNLDLISRMNLILSFNLPLLCPFKFACPESAANRRGQVEEEADDRDEVER